MGIFKLQRLYSLPTSTSTEFIEDRFDWKYIKPLTNNGKAVIKSVENSMKKRCSKWEIDPVLKRIWEKYNEGCINKTIKVKGYGDAVFGRLFSMNPEDYPNNFDAVMDDFYNTMGGFGGQGVFAMWGIPFADSPNGDTFYCYYNGAYGYCGVYYWDHETQRGRLICDSVQDLLCKLK
jgi:hypothetical protein